MGHFIPPFLRSVVLLFNPLFKPEQLPDAGDILAKKMARTAHNATAIVMLVWLISAKHFYGYRLKDLVIRAQSVLSREDLLSALGIPANSTLGAQFVKELKSARFAQLEVYFFEYLLVRLPYLLKTNRPNGLYPTETEIQYLTAKCLELGLLQMPLLQSHAWSRGSVQRITRLTRWWVRSSTREAAIYDFEWLWKALRSTYPKIFEESNRGFFARTVIEECQPMIYSHMVGIYREMTLWAYWLGGMESSPARSAPPAPNADVAACDDDKDDKDDLF